MKNKIILLIPVLLSVLTLCSFTRKESKNDNIYLQNQAKYTESAMLLESEEGSELDKIYDEFIASMPDGVPESTEQIQGFLGIEKAFRWIFETLSGKECRKTLFVLIAVGILFALAETLITDGASAETSRSAVGVVLCIPVFNIMRNLIFEVSESIERSSEIFSGIIPTVSALLSVGSGPGAASLSASAMSFSLGFVARVLSENLLPLSAMMFSLSMLSSFDTGTMIDGTAKGVRSVFNFLIGLSSLIIVGIVGMQTVIAVCADNLALKSAKYAISGMIPVVGGTVSGTLSALIGGVKLLSASIGCVSVIALVSVVAAPLLKLLFFRLCLGACISIASFSGGSFGARLFGSLRSSLDTLIAVLASSSLIYILETVIITSSIRGAL